MLICDINSIQLFASYNVTNRPEDNNKAPSFHMSVSWVCDLSNLKNEIQNELTGANIYDLQI